MHESDKNPERLVSVPNDLEAAMIVSALAAHDVDATTSGDYTAGFRAEAPGEVQVLVRHCDLTRAREALDALEIQSTLEVEEHAQSATFAQANYGDATRWLAMAILLLAAIGILQSCF